jgi:hypothetical protein
LERQPFYPANCALSGLLPICHWGRAYTQLWEIPCLTSKSGCCCC